MCPTLHCLQVILTVAIFLTTLNASKVPGVGSYRNMFGVGRYRLHKEAKEYTEAVKECAKEDAHLALPTSKGAEEVMVEIMQSERVEMAFVGINDRQKEGEMVTVKGQLYSEVGYTRWGFTEPNDQKGEDCVLISWNALLNDISCSTPFAFICEKNHLVPHDPY